MADPYQFAPRPGDMQFGAPLDYSDPTGTLPLAMALDTLAQGGQAGSASYDEIMRQMAAKQAAYANSINAIHPDVHAALIQAERRGGGQATLGGSWGQTVQGALP